MIASASHGACETTTCCGGGIRGDDIVGFCICPLTLLSLQRIRIGSVHRSNLSLESYQAGTIAVCTRPPGGRTVKELASKNRAEGDIDVAILSRFFREPSARRRIFVDVGAARPDYLSISARFREQGWRVIGIEPNPDFAQRHEELGYEIYRYACGTEDRDDASFQVVDSHSTPYEGGEVSYESFSALSIKPAYAALKPNLDSRTIHVKLRRLDTILGEHAPEVDQIDVLSADVEGWELEVLAGLNLARYRPKVMVLENFLRDRTYITRLQELGYKLWRRSFPNDVYVLPEMLEGAFESMMTRLNGWRFG